METFLDLVRENIDSAPWAIFGLLLLGGLNLPVSEDVMLFLSGVMAAENPGHAGRLFLGVFAGAYVSDIVCHVLFGRCLSQRVFRSRLVPRRMRERTIGTIERFYDRYGILTLFIGRFVPFGARNALFIAAGLGRMAFWRFALADLLSCLLSCGVYFSLYRAYGLAVVPWIERGGNAALLAAAALAALVLARNLRGGRGGRETPGKP